MTSINHAMTGAIIGLSVSNPWAAVCLAFVSHFALDALPHFGFANKDDENVKSVGFSIYLALNFVLCVLFVIYLAIFQSHNWLFLSVCAFVAASPDLFSINFYLTILRGKKHHPSIFMKFHEALQWFERPIGAVVEAVWFVSCIWVLKILLAK
jgi:hypothetical protein